MPMPKIYDSPFEGNLAASLEEKHFTELVSDFYFLRMFVGIRTILELRRRLIYITGDGCSHHASYHSMENQADDAVVKRWQAAERERQESNGDTGARKRPRRAIEDTTFGHAQTAHFHNETASAAAQEQPTTSRGSVKLRSRTRRGNAQQLDEQRIIDLSESGEVEEERGSGRLGFLW